MATVARLFLCARCRKQVCVCSDCDRGQQYCGEDCALAARRLSLKAAGRRYQSSRRGRARHAERMRRYRAKKAKSDASQFPRTGQSTELNRALKKDCTPADSGARNANFSGWSPHSA